MAYTPATPLQQVEALYIGYFGRAGEPGGVQYWVNQIQQGRTFAQVAAAFSVQAEAKAQHPFLANPSLVNPGDFVESLYQQIYGRASDATGKAYWVAQITAASGNPFSLGLLVAQFISGAQGDDIAVITNKVAAAEYFTGKLATAGIQGTDANGQVTPAVDQAATDIIGAVTKDTATVTAANAKSDQFAAGGNAGTPIVLTTAADNIQGTTGNDTLSGAVDTIANGGTFGNGDVIDLGGGTDTFNITVVGSGSFPAGATVKNVENFFIRQVDNVAGNLSFAGVQGAQQIWSNGSTQTLNVTDLQNNVTFGLKDTNAAYNATFTADKVGSTKATLNVATQGSTSTLTVDTNGTDVFTKANVNSTGTKSQVTLAAAQTADVVLTDLTVTGNASLTLIAGAGAEFTGLKTVNASGMTAGGLTIDLSGNATGTTELVFTGSAGNDTVTFAAADLNTKMTITGGAGTDVFAVAPNVAADSTLIATDVGAKITGFEVLRVAGGTLLAGVDVTVDASAVAGITDIQIGEIKGTAGAPAETVNVTNLPLNGTVTFLGDQDALTANTITFRAADLGATTRTANVVLGDGAGVDGTKNGVTIQSLSVDQATDVKLSSVGGVNTLTTFSADRVVNLSVSGDKAATFSLAGLDGPTGANDGVLAKVDASGLVLANITDTGLTIGAASADVAATGITVTGTNGVDTLLGTTEAGNKATFIGGAGADIMTGAANVQDTFIFRTGDSGKTIATADTVNTFDLANDVLRFEGITVTGTFGVGVGAFNGGGNASAFVDANNDVQIDFTGDGQIDMLVVGTFNGLTAGNFAFA